MDGTLGGGGHAREICRRIVPGGTLVGLDRDPAAVANAGLKLESPDLSVHLFNENYAHLASVLSRLGLAAVDGIVLDLGLSQYQLEASGRGFSFRRDEPLDMRMNPSDPTTAADLVNRLPEDRLARLFRDYGEERRAKRIARQIVRRRRQDAITTTGRLVAAIHAAGVRPAAGRRSAPATRVFMALRIAVNRELEHLGTFMEEAAADLLRPGGRLCVLAFHSLEDRIVKHRMRDLASGCSCPPDFPVCTCGKKPQVRVLTPRALRPTEAEIQNNPMARSTRLRVMEKLAVQA